MVIFISKYYGLEDVVKEWVCRSFDIIKNIIMVVVNKYGFWLFKELVMKILEFVNIIMGYVNCIVGYFNVIFIKVI